jgi:hypothetical protein
MDLIRRVQDGVSAGCFAQGRLISFFSFLVSGETESTWYVGH